MNIKNEEPWSGEKICDLEVISPNELLVKYADYIVVIGSMGENRYQIWDRLRAIGFQLENVVMFENSGRDCTVCENQYFDGFKRTIKRFL